MYGWMTGRPQGWGRVRLPHWETTYPASFISAAGPWTTFPKCHRSPRALVHNWGHLDLWIQGCVDRWRVSQLGLPYKMPRAEWLIQQKFIFSQLWRLEVRVRVPARLVSGENSLLDLQKAVPLLCAPVAFPLGSAEKEKERALWCPFS